MSAWTQLYNLGRSIFKRPGVWLGGIVVAGLTAATTDRVTDFFKSAETAISEKAAELSCRHRQKPIANDSQFTILVSPLANDPDGLYTEKVHRAFLSEPGFQAVGICQSLRFDFSPGKDNHTTKNEIVQRGMDLIKANHADLLLFGEASKEDKAVLIYAMNADKDRIISPRRFHSQGEGKTRGSFTPRDSIGLLDFTLDGLAAIWKTNEKDGNVPKIS